MASPATPVAGTEPRIRTMVIAVPDELPDQVLAARQLDRHFGVCASITPRFWARPCRSWNRHLLIDPRGGRPLPCAGGPLRRLDLDALRRAYGIGAGVRHRLFTQVTRGTRDAQPWVRFLQRHLDDPGRYPIERAGGDFGSQPRILAMRAHNALASGPGRLELDEVEMLQAGPVAYCHYHYQSAAVADAVLRLDGARMCPASIRFADRLAYVIDANRYLDTLDGHTRVVAVQV